MTKTEHYNLPQWEASDPVRREDFNDAMANIDAGISGTSYCVGSYIGNGLELSDGGLHVELGFHPRFVIISRGNTSALVSSSTFMCVECPKEGAVQYFSLEDTGFTVGLYSEASNPITINTKDLAYSFIAFQ